MKTQLELAKAGEITPLMTKIGKDEGFSPEEICQKVAYGEVVIPNNPNRPSQKAVGIGMGLRESDTELLQKMDAAITSMKEDGTLNELLVKWFGEEIARY